MNQISQTKNADSLEANITELSSRISLIKEALPLVRNFATRRLMGNQVKKYQADIFSMRKEIYKTRY